MRLFTGIDQSPSSTGIVTIDENGKVILSMAVTSKRTGPTFKDEILRLDAQARNVIREFPVQGCTYAMEGIAFGSNQTGHSGVVGLQYLIRKYMADMDLFPLVIGPTQVKCFVGKGNADKAAVMKAVKKLWKFKPKTNDEADAMILAQIARALAGFGTWTERQHEVLEKLKNQL